ncbi:MAG: hypothetical protein ABSD85_04950 [Acidimicrobiales bacterium]|jgi:hypothetical protein
MAIALAGFAATREIVTRWVRPYVFTPLHKTMAITSASPIGFDDTPPGVKLVGTARGIMPNAWVYSNNIVDKAGRAPTQAFLNHACPSTPRPASSTPKLAPPTSPPSSRNC